MLNFGGGGSFHLLSPNLDRAAIARGRQAPRRSEILVIQASGAVVAAGDAIRKRCQCLGFPRALDVKTVVFISKHIHFNQKNCF